VGSIQDRPAASWSKRSTRQRSPWNYRQRPAWDRDGPPPRLLRAFVHDRDGNEPAFRGTFRELDPPELSVRTFE